MAYYDVWKRKMQSNGADSTEVRLQRSRELLKRKFKQDPSYRQAVIQRNDLTKEPVDIRIKNIDKTVDEKRLHFLPETNIDVGNYVSWEDKTYILMEVEDNAVDKYALSFRCNQTLNYKGLSEPIPCYCDNSSYGTKGIVETNYLTIYDGKILFYVQYNEDTKKIRQDMRFIFDNDKHQVYKVVDINRVVTGNVLRFVMAKDEINNALDDVENNIAYNAFLESNEPIATETYEVKSSSGSFNIRRWTSGTYTIYNVDGTVASGFDISVDYLGNASSIATINEVDDKHIKITNNGYTGKTIKLIFTKDTTTIEVEVALIA